MKLFTTPYSKNIIATLRTITIELTELIFLIIFHVMHNTLGTLSFEESSSPFECFHLPQENSRINEANYGAVMS